jgi:hypothetical protein
VFIETNIIMILWLKNVPDNTIIFLRIMLSTTLIYCIANPMICASQATGNVKRYQIVCGSILLAILPVSYIFLKFGYPPYIVFCIHLFFELVCQFARMNMLRKLIDIPIKDWVRHVYGPILCVILASLLLPLGVHFIMKEGILRLMCVSLLSFVSVAVFSYILGLNKHEKKVIVSIIKNKIGKI